MYKRIILFTALGIAMLLFGCAPDVGIGAPKTITVERVNPAAEIRLGEERTIEVRLGLINQTDQALAGKDDFTGQWVLLNSEGEVRASGYLYAAGPMNPHEHSFPLTWRAELDAGTYTLTWGAPSVGTTIVEFEVQRDDTGVGVGTQRQQTTDEYLVEPQGS